MCPRLGQKAHPACARALHVSLEEIEIEGVRLGIYPEERVKTQRVEVRVYLALDPEALRARDDIAVTVHYAHVIDDVMALCRARHFDLLETLVLELTEGVMARHPKLVGVRCAVEKLEAPVPARVVAQWALCRGVVTDGGA